MSPLTAAEGIQPLLDTVKAIGAPLQIFIAVAALALLVVAFAPDFARWRRLSLGVMTALLVGGEGVLMWMHWRLYQMSVVVDPATGGVTGRVAVSMWVEGEKLYMWALMVALLGVLMKRHRDQLLPGVMVCVAILSIGGVLAGQPFTNPLPGFLSQYAGYLQAMTMGGVAADGAFQGMEGSRQFFYNSWFMWVHPPMLFFSYGAFTISFIATLKMISTRHSAFETTAYRWARLGYLPLTVGMLLGFPWALSAWTGEAWWWSGKVNMSMMMWLLYTAYLHARLYLRRKGMWKAVAALAVLSFLILVLTYITTYVVPGAHSYALEPSVRALASIVASCRGGVA
jgi:ABC-type transport system involved in cytochrome c biogenesis permease subunit